MPNPAAVRKDDRPPGPSVEAAEFDELRALIVGPEQRQLRTLQARLNDPATQTREVSRVLPQAMLLRKDDPQLTRALAPTIEEAITTSVRRNPRPLADALFPIFGPAIRKAIAASLRTMLDSMNQTLEHSLSWRAVQWRVTALRTGKSFAEIVLLNTLVYRVEQVFLIHRDSGLLLLHVTAPSSDVQDADMISGMLTAIRDFVGDSLRVSADETLDALQVGGLSVLIEQGPHAVLAVVVRGTAPADLRTTMQETLEHVHAKLGDVLVNFEGDTTPFEAVRPALDNCLQSQYRTEKKRSRRTLWLAAAIVLLAIGVWGAFAWAARQRANAYVNALRSEPGIVVLSAERRGGKLVVNGLRDPLARDPLTFAAGTGHAVSDIAGNWQLYQALEPSLVVARARNLLQPPQGVTLQFDNGVLAAEGAAPLEWIRESRRLASVLPGVVRYDPSNTIEAALRAVGQQLEATDLVFTRGATEIEPGAAATLTEQLDRIRTLDALAGERGRRLRVELVGHADADGPPVSNDPLSVKRAERVRQAAAGLGLRHLDLTATGVGSRQPRSLEPTDDAKRANRRVTTHVHR